MSEDFLKSHLQVLAHDSLFGRGTGQKGSRITADYLYDFYSSDSFSSAELEILRQPFSLEGVFWDAVEYTVYSPDGEDTQYLSETQLFPGGNAGFYPVLGGSGSVDAPVVFAGFSSTDQIFKSIDPKHPDIENAWVMVFEQNFLIEHNDQQAQTNYFDGRADYVRSVLSRTDAEGIIFISEFGVQQWEELAVYMSQQLERPLGVGKGGVIRGGGYSSGTAVSIHPELAAEILGYTRTAQLDSLRQAWSEYGDTVEPLVTGYYLRNNPVIYNRSFEEENILAIIPGVDPERSEEILLLSAHYDHMGLGEPDGRDDIVYSGADDNASGTSVLLQIAEAFRLAADQGYRPSRTIVFLHAAAEEWGLLGSRYYVQNPVFPNNNIVANVNVDMVGHIDNEYADDEKVEYIYIIGAGLISSGLQELVDQTNQASVNLELDEKYNSTSHPLNLYRRSDHWAFGEQNIPFVFFFSGLHDNYHVPSDTADRIVWPLLAERTKLVTELVWRLAEARDRPVVDQDRFENRRHPSR